MHTVLVLAGGFLILALCHWAGWWVGAAGAVTGATIAFLPIWQAATGYNLWMGVAQAGYTVAEELPIFAGIFTLPAAVALLIWWEFS